MRLRLEVRTANSTPQNKDAKIASDCGRPGFFAASKQACYEIRCASANAGEEDEAEDEAEDEGGGGGSVFPPASRSRKLSPEEEREAPRFADNCAPSPSAFRRSAP